MKWIYLLVLGLIALSSVVDVSRDRSNKPFKVVCYYDPSQIIPEHINPFVCTHINYAYATLDNNTIQLSVPSRDGGILGDTASGEALIRRTVSLRMHNRRLTFLISIGGFNDGSTKYSEMVNSDENRATFIQSVLGFLDEYKLDGLDIDWEYPAFTGIGNEKRNYGHKSDKQMFTVLLKELRSAFEPHGYLLTAAVSANTNHMLHSYEIWALNEYPDFVNLLSFDYTDKKARFTSHNAPLLGAGVIESVRFLTARGLLPKKIVMGIPLFGHGYMLSSTKRFHVGAQTRGAVLIDGTYRNLCRVTKQMGWRVLWDSYASVPFAVNHRYWITFDNLASVSNKLLFLSSSDLGGAMVWSIGMDDYQGFCGMGKYPMMKLIMNRLNNVRVNNYMVAVPNVYQKLWIIKFVPFIVIIIFMTFLLALFSCEIYSLRENRVAPCANHQL